MTGSAGAGRDKTPGLTRPDMPLPKRPGSEATAGDPLPTPPAPPEPPRQPEPGPGTGSGGRNWHRWHYPVGVFLTAYGVTTLAATAIGWSDRRAWFADYVGSGLAVPALVAVKVVELLLVLVALAGLLRRRDVWFLPALAGWMAGFGVFAVLDLVKGEWLALLEHGAYLAGFAVLLFVSYGLSVRARVGRRPAASAAPRAGGDAPGGGLTRTQEFALAALERWQRTQQNRQQPPQGPTP
ncbi:hypothetical protein [Actinomadura kijaniata]|uniref:hypothetical protein n=1 Tax=Actinomadura kijaniata TaxID=46161 RepID=UPI0008295071|nr:hypothetical protein [Actinomadura kijaniata]